MKFLQLSIFFYLTLLTMGCSTDPSTAGIPNQQISLRANGVLFSVTTGGAGVTKADAHINSGKLNLNATAGDKDFSLYYSPATLNTALTAGNTALNFAQWEDGTNLYTTSAGTNSVLNFTITRQQARSGLTDYSYVEGTFSGVLRKIGNKDSVVITEGQFKIL
ncbi:MAG: hypothetical protein IPK03_00195 [Bacteroidetes bacterium]|nr:hypothetical protein [Bacteroidota bacterium]